MTVKTILIALLCWCSLVACKAPQVVTLKETRDTTIIREIPKVVEVPGTRIEQTINLDSIKDLLSHGVPIDVINKTLVKYDTTGKAQMKLLLDEMGGLTAICETQDQYIDYLEKEVTKMSFEREQVQETIIKPKTPFWIWMLIGGLGALLVACLLLIFLYMLRTVYGKR